MPISEKDLTAALHWRYSVKIFDPARKIAPAVWAALESALVLSPSSYGLQPYRFIDVKDPAVRKKLTPASWNQAQVESADRFVVFAARTDTTEADVKAFINLIADTRNVPPESLAGYEKMMMGSLVTGPRHALVAEWAARQAYIALGNLLTSAALVGVDACPMEGIDAAAYDDILGLKGGRYRTLFAAALGYRSPEDKYQAAKKVRFSPTELLQTV
jgi:nitroreductase